MNAGPGGGPGSARERDIVDACLAMGFALAGVTPARASERASEVHAWLKAGKHGEMAFMTELLDERLDITRMLPGARSVIMVADRYASGQAAPADEKAANVSRVARYARGRDYHTVIKRRLKRLCDRLRELHPGAEFRSFVDTGPVLEREQAARAFAGRGAFIGKHTLLIDPRAGSWLLLGGVASTLDITPEHADEPGRVRTDACGGCTRCIDACPTGAITAFEVDARRCVSYLTLEHAGAVDRSLLAGHGDWLIGCDVCQEVCPFNRERGGGPSVHPAYADTHPARAELDTMAVLRWSEEDRRRVLSGSAGKRASLEMLRRSAVINAGNFARRTGDADAIDAIARIATDPGESEVMRRTASDVLAWLRDDGASPVPPPITP